MSTNLEYRERERQRKRESGRHVGGRPGKLNEKKGDRDLEREILKQRRHFFVGRTTWKFFAARVAKWEMLAATNARWKWAAVKKVNGNTYDISSIKRVTKKFLEVSRCSRAKQRQRNVQKKCAARAKFLLLIRPIVVFHRFPALHAFAA